MNDEKTNSEILISLMAHSKNVPTTGTINIFSVFDWIETKDYTHINNNIIWNDNIDQFTEDSKKTLPHFFKRVTLARDLKSNGLITEYKKAKANLPCILPHAYGISAKRKDLLSNNKIMFFDVDEEMSIEEELYFENYIKSLPYTLAIAKSTSNKYHIFIKVSNYNSDDEFNCIYYQLLQDLTFGSLSKKLFDTAVGQITRKAFLSTELIYRNDSCTEYTPDNIISSDLATKIKSIFNLKALTKIEQKLTENDVVVTEYKSGKTIQGDDEISMFLYNITKSLIISGTKDFNGSAKMFFNRVFSYDIEDGLLEDTFFKIFPYSEDTKKTYNEMYKNYSGYSEYRSKECSYTKNKVNVDNIIKKFDNIITPDTITPESKDSVLDDDVLRLERHEKLRDYTDLIYNTDGKNLYLCADTKTGKTTTTILHYKNLIDNNEEYKDKKLVFLVPFIVTGIDVQNKMDIFIPGIDFIRGGSKDIDTTKNVFISTYDSFSTKFLTEFKISDIILVVDEFHLFTSSASVNFRRSVIEDLSKLFNNTHQTILLTGTPINFIGLDSFEKRTVRFKDKIKDNVYFNVSSTNKKYAMLANIKKYIDLKTGVVVLYNNDKVENEKIEKYFIDQKIKTQRLDADIISTSEQTGDIIEEDTQLLITTSVFEVGLGTNKIINSIHFNINYNNQASFVSEESLVQITNRDNRLNTTINIKDIHFYFSSIRDNYENLAEMIKTDINEVLVFIKSIKDYNSTTIEMVLDTRDNMIKEIVNDNATINKIGLSYFNYIIKKNYYYNNLIEFAKLLKNNENFDFKGMNKTPSVIGLDSMKKSVKIAKIAIDDKVNNEIECALNKISLNDKQLNKYEQKINKLYIELVKYIDSDIAKDIIINEKGSTSKIQQIILRCKNQYNLIYAMNNEKINTEVKDVFNKALSIVKNMEDTDSYYTIDAIQSELKKSKTFSKLNGKCLLDKLSQWFVIDRKLIGNSRTTKYKLILEDSVFNNIYTRYKVINNIG